MALAFSAAPYFVADALLHPAWAREPAPVIDATGEAGMSASSATAMEKRVSRLERLLENQTLVDLMTRMDSLQNQVQDLLGQVEEQTHNMEQLKKRQRDLYLDIDRRLQTMEKAQASMPSTPAAAGSVFGGAMPGAPLPGAPVPATAGAEPGMAAATGEPGVGDSQVDAQQERAAYERAFNLLKDGRYDLAVAAFKSFMQSYPAGQFADNAQYWLGEANYVQRHFKVALNEFDKVVKNFPNSPKRADALLKLGYSYQELGDINKARLSLNEVVMSYPNSTAASLAQKRLQALKQLQ
jgi:tol-pal system protein YbgF